MRYCTIGLLSMRKLGLQRVGSIGGGRLTFPERAILTYSGLWVGCTESQICINIEVDRAVELILAAISTTGSPTLERRVVVAGIDNFQHYGQAPTRTTIIWVCTCGSTLVTRARKRYHNLVVINCLPRWTRKDLYGE